MFVDARIALFLHFAAKIRFQAMAKQQTKGGQQAKPKAKSKKVYDDYVVDEYDDYDEKFAG